MVWIAAIIAIILLLAFPKQVGILVSIAVAGAGLLVLFFYIQEETRKKELDSVSVSVRYDPTICPEGYPISVSFKNGSSKTIKRVAWNIAARKPGHSSNVIEYDLYRSEYSTSYSSDKILAPGAVYALCYTSPKLQAGLSPSSVDWDVLSKSVIFDK
jgi:hypothetical protein